ncbi:PAS domain S-box protein [Halorubellus sp. PRR65]|uniref:PAS domain S-box protein n=1 Tax=Halorubellus sp. PRR65 TaxID=3098148 RepID=UPI002B25A56A|nr:PAS domain S-box protein [Halorubellus sp. PRR65]
MTAARARPVRVGVVGADAVVDGVRSGSGSVDRRVDVCRVAPDTTEQVDCVVVDTTDSTVDATGVVDRFAVGDGSTPVALLVGEWTDDGVLGALATTDVVTLPRALLERDPGVLATRLVRVADASTPTNGRQGDDERADRGARAEPSATERERYEQVFDDVNDLILVYDPWEPALVDVNASALAVTGYDREQLLDLGLEAVSATDDGYTAARAFEIQRRVAETGDAETVDWVVETADGDRRRLDCTLSPATIGGEERVLVLARDVTERHQLEETYRGVFENVSDGLVVHDPETGEIRDVNERFCEMNGYEREELVGETIDVVTAPYHGIDAAQEKIRAARAEGPQLFEWQSERRDGTTFPAEIHLSVVEIRGAERVLASVRDVTERERREREYQQIFDGVTEAIAIQDPETAELVDANASFVDRLGYDDLETLLDLDFNELSGADAGFTKGEAQALCRRVMSSGESETVEWQQETADGDTIHIEATVSPAVIDGEDRVVSMQRDITERRQREREYEQIFNSVNDAIAVFHPETAEFVDVNDTYHEMVGYDDVETIRDLGIEGLSVSEGDYTGERGREIIRAVAESGESRTIDWRAVTRSGDRLWIEATLTPATIGGEERVLSLQRDVTEQRLTERRLRAIVDRIDEAIFMTRADAITAADQDPDYVSSGYEAIWGRSLAAIEERYDDGFFGTLHPEDRSDYRAFVDDVVDDVYAGRADDRYSVEYRIERPDGTERWVHSDCYPIAFEGDAPRVVIVSRDVTQRKAHERRIASFEAATDGLATADTPAEATRTAVDAATDALELPAVGAFLYDDGDGVLEPAVGSGALPSAVTTAPIRPGEGPIWEAFAAGGVVAPGDGTAVATPGAEPPGSETGLGALADWRALALGNHGVLLVGSMDEPLPAKTIDAAHVLAATLEAALNHLQGQQRLAAQEAELRTQTERAERLDRIARLTRRVEAAITDASTAREVERAVCERLASAGPYELAWVGGLEAGADTLTSRAVVGGTDRYVDGLGLETTGETADPHPAVRAWQTDDVHVTESIVDAGPAGEWRQRALAAGYQSICAVPISYDGITHGVLSVATDRPNAFGDREQGVLAQLGTSIGDAIVAIERRRALESDETVQLEFTGRGDALSFARAARVADCRVTLERTAARQDGAVSVYYSFDRGVPDDVADIASGELDGAVTVVAAESTSTLVEVRADDWFGSPLAEYGGVLRTATADPAETTVVVEVPQQADVRSFVERLQAIAPSLELVARRQHNQETVTPAELGERVREELTDRQFEVLQTALAAGYFEWPRDNDGNAVADRLDITQPTLNKHLRLAEKQIFTLLLDDDS